MASSSGSSGVANLARARGRRLHGDAPPVGGIWSSLDEAGLLEPVEDAGDGPGRQAGELREAARGEAGLGDRELQAAQVGGVEAEVLGEGLVVGGRADGLTDAVDVVHDADYLTTRDTSGESDDHDGSYICQAATGAASR